MYQRNRPFRGQEKEGYDAGTQYFKQDIINSLQMLKYEQNNKCFVKTPKESSFNFGVLTKHSSICKHIFRGKRGEVIQPNDIILK
jgi:hypothetical protein